MIETRGIDTLEKLRKFNLAQELEDFKFVCKEIEKAFALGRKPKWLLIVVNKADLFFDDESLNRAQNYYHPNGTSAFSQIIQNTLRVVGEQRLKCNSVPLCSFEKSLTWNKDLAETGMKGEENRKALMVNFFNIIATF